LALWQANQVEQSLHNLGVSTCLVPIKSPGDLDLDTPLHQFGTTGIFTKILDVALEENRIDIAVHSLKDYPTQLPPGLCLPAVLKRGAYRDVLIPKGDTQFLQEKNTEAVIATGSIRRIAQWKKHYPKHKTPNLRGNVQTRLNKLAKNPWQGAIFAKAGLERINLLPANYLELDWMIPAPAQGVVGIGCRETDADIIAVLKQINHQATYLRAKIERDFLNEVEGGCSAPVGALTQIKDNNILIEAGVFALDGSDAVICKKSAPLEEAEQLGRLAAREVLNNGGAHIMESIAHG
jgi:hydroxymethylbilane synthase